MTLEGDKSVIDALKEKKRLMESDESHAHIQPLLYVDGGLMKGAYAAGAGIALEELNYTDVFSQYVGVSSGAAELAYFLSRKVQSAVSVMYEECCTKNFFNPLRINRPIDTKFIGAVLRGQTGKPIDVDRVLSYRDKLYFVITEYETAAPVLFRPENAEELFAAIEASISLPGVTGSGVEIKGTRYVDGAAGASYGLLEAMRLPSTHILVLTNQDKDTPKIPWIENVINNIVYRHRMSHALRVASARRREVRHEAILTLLKDNPKPILFVWGNGSIGSFERDASKVKGVVERSRRKWHEWLT